ncbi:hypothetical protein CJ030_MR1G020809 [Morella rubra]|uniref:PGG domain-containing protein n=1 Tax=Morella rubra TaxID=262757 RepID=A0A6A1WKB6_9ROSI|nr:hypothetical protein CJ030_MR1G020809 [Morella rubra]
MAPRVALEALRKDNYANWSVSMKNYLLAHNLWDIIETTMEPPTPEDDIVKYEAWTEKNASALNAIGLSCGLDIFSQIKKINSAKVVWDMLAKMYAQPAQGVLNSIVEQGNSSNGSSTKEDKSQEAAGSGDARTMTMLNIYPLVNAVRSGELDALKDFLALNPEGTSAKITFNGDQTALHIAVRTGHVHVVEELVKRMSDENLAIQDSEGYTALAKATCNGDFRMVQCMIDKNPKLREMFSLYALASTSDAFPSGKQLVFWKQWVYSCIHIQPSRASDEIRVNIQNVQEKTIRTPGSGEPCPSHDSRHLNKDGLTPKQLFTQNHEDLRKKGRGMDEEYGKFHTVVGALIVIIMFAAVFTVPGGNDQNTGFSMFLNKKLFILFMIFDSLSLFSSSASVLMFMGILTSRYAEDDFLKSLPKKMIIGLFALFFSIKTMMVTFSITLLLMLRGKSLLLFL